MIVMKAKRNRLLAVKGKWAVIPLAIITSPPERIENVKIPLAAAQLCDLSQGSTARCWCCWCCSKIDSFQLVAWHVKLHHLTAVNYPGRADLWGSGKPESQTRRYWHGLLAEWNNPLLFNLSRQIISAAPTDGETVLLYNMKPWGRKVNVGVTTKTGFWVHFTIVPFINGHSTMVNVCYHCIHDGESRPLDALRYSRGRGNKSPVKQVRVARLSETWVSGANTSLE